MINTNTRIPSVQGTQSLIGNPTLPNPQNNIFIFGNRIPLDTPLSGVVTFPACVYVDVVTLAAQNEAIVYYTNSAPLVQSLTSDQLQGTFNDTTQSITGTFVSAVVESGVVSTHPYTGYIILKSTSFATIATGDVIAVTYQNMGLPILNPNSGYPFLQYYQTYQMPTQYLNDPLGMLSYFSNCGFDIQTGYNNTIVLNNASYVDTTTLAANQQAIVYYTSSSALIDPLVGIGIQGTFNDTTANISGVFISAEVGEFVVGLNTYDSKIILESAQYASIVINDVINIAFVNSNVLSPNPNYTEPFIMNLWQAIQASLIPLNENSTVATPNVFFSFLPDATHSGLFGATSTPLTLSIPTVVSGSVISFAIPSLNVGYIPMAMLGDTTITQATSNAVGTVSMSVVNGNVLNVTLSNITGSFDTTHVCTLNLDSTQTVFTSQKKLFAQRNISLQDLALPYQVNSSSDITGQYSPAFTYVKSLNEPATAQDGQALCFIHFSNLTIPINSAVLSLPTNVNNWQYIPSYYPYNPLIGDLPLSAGQLSAAYAMVIGSNVTPLNPQGGVVINGLPKSSNPNDYLDVSINGIADQILQIGWNATAINNNDQAFIINPITGQTTLPGLPTPDKEFYNTYVWQTVDYLRKIVTNDVKAIGLGQIRQNPTKISQLKTNIVSDMVLMEDDNMLKNVLANQSLITIIQDPTNPLGIDITIPMQIIPGLEFVYYTLNIFSSTVTLQLAA